MFCLILIIQNNNYHILLILRVYKSLEHEEEEKKSAESWMASLVPEVKSVLESSDYISEEKITLPETEG